MERVVTISASYGAGGSIIGPSLAKALDVPFLDRAVPARATSGDHGTTESAVDEERTSSLIERIVATFANMPDAFAPGAPPAPARAPDEELRRETEARVRSFVAAHGAGVILGWGATVLLPDAFHVRLHGPEDRRILQAMRIEGLDREEAERRRQDTDRVRGQYMKRIHGRDVHDASLFHLVLDSTALDLDDAVRLLATAATAYWGHHEQAPFPAGSPAAP